MPRLSAETSTGWSASSKAGSEQAAPWVIPTPADPAARAPWAAPAARDAAAQSPWPTPKPADPAATVPWGQSARHDAPTIRAPWVLSSRADRHAQIDAFAAALVPASQAYLVLWLVSATADSSQRISGSGDVAAQPAQHAISSAWVKQRAADEVTWIPWGMGRRLENGTVIVVEPGDPLDPGSPGVIPIRSTYIVINDVTLVRLPDNTAIDAYSLSLKWDSDSWSVGWSASLPASALDAVMPGAVGEPVELQATINGTAVRLLAESIARDRRFGDARLSVSGRGRVAWLADPYAQAVARTAATDMTAQQLAADALTQNGVPVGWALNWQLADWLVPAGVWSHQGTMIDAVKRIAEAAGGYVLGHRTAQTLHVRPRYPLLPWEWASATPDIVIPSAVASTEAINWSESPAYNRVFVAGQEHGRMGQITRAGTAGDIVAPMVTDPLITHSDASRARGASILAAGGRQATVALRLPVLPTTGILDLGQLIEYQDGATSRRGLVRAVSVEAGLPSVWQTVEIETHA